MCGTTETFLEYSFFVFSHATDVSQTMIDSELHRFPRANFDQAVDIIKTFGSIVQFQSYVIRPYCF